MIEQMQNIVAFWSPGPLELIVILIIAVLLFGRRLPEIARGMGKSLMEFKKGVKEAKDEVTKAADAADVTDENNDENAEDILRPK